MNSPGPLPWRPNVHRTSPECLSNAISRLVIPSATITRSSTTASRCGCANNVSLTLSPPAMKTVSQDATATFRTRTALSGRKLPSTQPAPATAQCRRTMGRRATRITTTAGECRNTELRSWSPLEWQVTSARIFRPAVAGAAPTAGSVPESVSHSRLAQWTTISRSLLPVRRSTPVRRSRSAWPGIRTAAGENQRSGRFVLRTLDRDTQSGSDRSSIRPQCREPHVAATLELRHVGL